MATPFKFVAKFRGYRTNRPHQMVVSCNDVTANKATAQSGATVFNLPTGDDWVMFDVISGAAATVTYANIFVGGRAIPEQLIFASNLATNQSRQFNGAPVVIKGGSTVEFEQIT